MAGSAPPRPVPAPSRGQEPARSLLGRPQSSALPPHAPFFGSALPWRPQAERTDRELAMGVSSSRPGSRRRRRRKEKVSGPAQLPTPGAIVGRPRAGGRPLAAGSGSSLGTKAAAPPPGQRPCECPRLLRCHQPPKPAARAEYSDLPAHCEAPCPFIIPLHDLSQTINTSRPGSSLGAEDSQMSGAWFTG